MYCPFDYSLCNQTVTVYRQKQGRISRSVYRNGYLAYDSRVDMDTYGPSYQRRFTLILPGDQLTLELDDRIFDGEGPSVSSMDWPDFIPAKVEGLMQVRYVQPCFWNGRLCHTEAGDKGSFTGFGG